MPEAHPWTQHYRVRCPGCDAIIAACCHGASDLAYRETEGALCAVCNPPPIAWDRRRSADRRKQRNRRKRRPRRAVVLDNNARRPYPEATPQEAIMAEAAIRIPRHAVRSSNLAGVGYDVRRKILAVEFQKGGIIHYAGVEPHVVEDLTKAESLGRFYIQEIRGKYQGEMMTGRCPACGTIGWIGDTCEDCGCAVYVAIPRKGDHDGDEDTAAARGPEPGD